MSGQPRLLAAHDFALFSFGCGVDFLDVRVGHLLDIVQGAALFVLADEFVLQQLLQVLIGVAADVARGHAVVLSYTVQALYDFPAALLGERRNRHPDQLAIVRRIEAQIRISNSLLDGGDLRYVPRLDGDQRRLGNVQIGHLIYRSRSTVIIYLEIVENAHRRAAGADAGDGVLQIRQHFVHASLGVGLQLFDVLVIEPPLFMQQFRQLVGFLVGVVLSYLSAQQLRTFGADLYIVNLLGVAVVRELGPVLAAVLVAGRSGSAMTAQIGVMRVTEELDALSVLGIPHTLRLVLPKMVALAVAMPLLSMASRFLAGE